ncbi:hypothetical protein [Streptococcus devriesei]|uniref:hypothetical protein n=1 Tax=Streptococcus devriesei TaxID=231233 RepID=UPI0003F93B79|nr:hypothetical protein [Streptococcus devriesei]
MVTKQHHSAANILLFFTSFIAAKWFYDTFLRVYAHYISNYGLDFALFLNVIITLILSYFTFVLLKFCCTQQIKSTSIIISYLIYSLLLVYAILLKNIGHQGLVLDPLSFIHDIANGSRFVPAMNLLMFIPIGFLYPPSKANLSLSLLGLILLESCQYVFHLGVLDLGDISLNFISLLIGNSFHISCLPRWIEGHTVSRSHQS